MLFYISSLTPFMGFFLSTPLVVCIHATQLGIRLLCSQVFFSGISASLLTLLHLPTLSGTLYLSTRSRLLKAGIPIACSLLFLIHPVGWVCGPYIVHWVLPVALTFISCRSIFLQSLASTLTTHAVGTVMWLYMHPTTPAFWYSLAKIVWLERLVYALFLTAFFYAIRWLLSHKPDLLIFAQQSMHSLAKHHLLISIKTKMSLFFRGTV